MPQNQKSPKKNPKKRKKKSNSSNSNSKNQDSAPCAHSPKKRRKRSKSPYATFSVEYSLLKSGHKFVAGIDEAGRGPLAGPVVASVAVVSHEDQFISGIRDSKLMTAKAREEAYELIKETVEGFGIGKASHKEIDELGIGEATKLAMSRAYDYLRNKPDYVLIDGANVAAPVFSGRQVKSGDKKHFVISAASVLAKVYRDRIMKKYSEYFPEFGFEHNSGYGTKQHREALQKYGACVIHRRSFSPVTDLVKRGKLYEKN